MIKETNFIGVSFGVLDNKLLGIATSNGYAVGDSKGLSTATALAFLWSLTYVREPGDCYVCFDSSVDFELMIAGLTKWQKDKLFGVLRKKEERVKDTPLYEPPPVDGREVVEALGYRMSAIPGKVFRLTRKKQTSLVLFDIESFFCVGDLRETVAHFLGESVPGLEKNLLPLWSEAVVEKLLDRCELEAEYIRRLALKVKATLEPLNLKMRQWYGPSAIAARCLAKWEARAQMKRLTPGNSASELLKAIDCAYVGGRVEVLKLGTLKDVRVFDLNSAYAYAVTLLSQFYQPLRFTRAYHDNYAAPFSCWLVDYELPADVQLGILPTRSTTGAISFRRRGRGYFWQPEIDYLRQRYPDCFGVKWGYMARDYQPVKFAKDVESLYQYRNELKMQGDKGESVVKLALANLYGKFAQNTGSAHFQCRAWAGWITSLVRRLLLEAVTGIEDQVICFCQDAVHVTEKDCRVDVGQGLGQWKVKRYDRGLYVAPGVYHLSCEAGDGKKASRGASVEIDFDKLASELSERQVTVLCRSFFVGWQLARSAPLAYESRYLSEVEESLNLIPANLSARNYKSVFNWGQEFRDSTINTQFSGQLSARYIPQEDTTGSLRLKLKDRGWA